VNSSSAFCAGKCNSLATCAAFAFNPYNSYCVLYNATGPVLQTPVSYLYVKLAIIPAKLVLIGLGFQGTAFSFNASAEFTSPYAITYKVQGLPTGTGLKLAKGVVSGTPNAQDSGAKQPLVLTISGADGHFLNASLTLLLTIGPQKPTGFYIGSDGLVGQDVTLPLAPYFAASYNATTFVSYSVSRLPTGSGLSLDSKTGVLSGTLATADAAAKQPLTLVATASGSNANAKGTLSVIFTVMTNSP